MSQLDGLTKGEKSDLTKLRRMGGLRLCTTKTKCRILRRLATKGIVEELPGLLDGMPQGFILRDAYEAAHAA